MRSDSKSGDSSGGGASSLRSTARRKCAPVRSSAAARRARATLLPRSSYVLLASLLAFLPRVARAEGGWEWSTTSESCTDVCVSKTGTCQTGPMNRLNDIHQFGFAWECANVGAATESPLCSALSNGVSASYPGVNTNGDCNVNTANEVACQAKVSSINRLCCCSTGGNSLTKNFDCPRDAFDCQAGTFNSASKKCDPPLGWTWSASGESCDDTCSFAANGVEHSCSDTQTLKEKLNANPHDTFLFAVQLSNVQGHCNGIGPRVADSANVPTPSPFTPAPTIGDGSGSGSAADVVAAVSSAPRRDDVSGFCSYSTEVGSSDSWCSDDAIVTGSQQICCCTSKTQQYSVSSGVVTVDENKICPLSINDYGCVAGQGWNRATLACNLCTAEATSGLCPDAPIGTSQPTSAPTSAPTLAEYTIVDAFCEDRLDCRVEGGETLTVIGRGFGDMTSFSINVGSNVCGSPAGNATALIVGSSEFGGEYTGYEKATCTTPCFTSFNTPLAVAVSGTCANGIDGCSGSKTFSTPSFRNNADAKITTLGSYRPVATLDYVCSAVPTLTSVGCFAPNDNSCDSTGSGTSNVKPAAKLILTGTNFGPGPAKPDSAAVSELKLMVGQMDCTSTISAWSATQITFQNCVTSAATNLLVVLTVGTKTTTDTVQVNVVVSSLAPATLGVSLGTQANDETFTVIVAWTAPKCAPTLCTVTTTTRAHTGYVLEYSGNAADGAGAWDSKVVDSNTKVKTIGDVNTLTLSVPDIPMGKVLKVRIRAKYNGDAIAAQDQKWTNAYAVQAALPPVIKPNSIRFHFVGINTAQSGTLDMLMRFTVMAVNGGTPDTAKIIYRKISDGTTAGQSIIKLPSSASEMNGVEQLGVMSKFPKTFGVNVSIEIITKVEEGFSYKTLSSLVFVPKVVYMLPPRAVTKLAVSFGTVKSGENDYSASLTWERAQEGEGDAPVTDHTIRTRKTSPADSPCKSAGATHVNTTDGTVVCTRAYNASLWASVEDEQKSESTAPRFIYTKLALGHVHCFFVRAESKLGLGKESVNEVCIDVSAAIRSSCKAGEVLTNEKVFTCDTCELGTFSAVNGAACESCIINPGVEEYTFTPVEGATTCETCSEGFFLESSTDKTCTLCPTSKLLTCSKGKRTWVENKMMNPSAWYDVGEWVSTDDGLQQWSSNVVKTSLSMEVHECFNDVSCMYNASFVGDQSEVVCNTEAGYFGPLCGGCAKEDGWMRDGYVCSKCQSPALNWLILALLALVVVLLMVHIAAFRSTRRYVGEYGGVIRRIAFNYIQMLGVLGIFKARGTKVFDDARSKTYEVAGGSITSMLAIKCLLNTQIYGPFVVTMLIPIGAAVLIVLIMIPTTIIKRSLEKKRRELMETRRERRELAAVSDERKTLERPRFEPYVNCGSLCCKVPVKVQLSVPCCRKPATDEYATNVLRKNEGRRHFAPRYRPWLSVDARMLGGVPRALFLSCERCRVPTTEEERGAWRAETAVREQRGIFKPARRLVAVMVLVMYGLFPTVVASTASIFNCTSKIGDKSFLMADLTVTCFEGDHIIFIVAAAVSMVVYCFGTPVLFTLMVIFDMLRVEFNCGSGSGGGDTNGGVLPSAADVEPTPEPGRCGCCTCACICMKRNSTPWGFRTSSVRERLGLLVVGYDTQRGSLVMAWEPLIVMTRKLCITLAGSLLRDPYIQIMCGLMILVISLTLQALVQPYESKLLNVLDVGSLVVLIATQILSILYLYLESVESYNSNLETVMTCALFIVNLSVIVVLIAAWIARYSYEKLAKMKRKVREARKAGSLADKSQMGGVGRSSGTSDSGVELSTYDHRKSRIVRSNPLLEADATARFSSGAGVEEGSSDNAAVRASVFIPAGHVTNFATHASTFV